MVDESETCVRCVCALSVEPSVTRWIRYMV